MCNVSWIAPRGFLWPKSLHKLLRAYVSGSEIRLESFDCSVYRGCNANLQDSTSIHANVDKNRKCIKHLYWKEPSRKVPRGYFMGYTKDCKKNYCVKILLVCMRIERASFDIKTKLYVFTLHSPWTFWECTLIRVAFPQNYTIWIKWKKKKLARIAFSQKKFRKSCRNII